jgi:hypothetical protein
MVVFPVTLFLGESDLTPLSERIDEFVYGLTKWEPEIKEKGILAPPKVTVEGKDYQETFANMNDTFLLNQWGDGLPLLPPTGERVDWILTGTDLPRDKEIARIAPRGGIATVEQLAVSLAMAGGRPEYLPVLIAIAEGLGHPDFRTASWQTTSRSNIVVGIVNGPIGKQIRLSSTFGLMGPDSQRPAGARIGRALRLMQQDMGGATPGAGTMSVYGLGRITNCIFAEDEARIPAGFAEPLNTDPRYGGFPKGTNTVLLNISCQMDNIARRGMYIGETLEEEMAESLEICGYFMRIPQRHYPNGADSQPGTSIGVFVMNSLVAEQMFDQGWTKESIQQRLWELTHTPRDEWLSYRYITRQAEFSGFNLADTPEMVPMYYRPDNLIFVVAGGRHPTHCYWFGENTGRVNPINEIQLPAKWDDLLAQAEEELGPIPVDP